MSRRIGITCVMIVVVIILLTAIILLGGLGVFFWGNSHPQATITRVLIRETTSCDGAPCPATSTQTVAATDTTGAGNLPSFELPSDIASVMDQIQSDVIDIRGLSPNSGVPRALLTPAELKEMVLNDFMVDYSSQDAHGDEQTLFLMGLLPINFDLITFYQELFSEQIAGFYDDESKEMYVVRDSGFNGLEKMTYAHEYTHVLQDQSYDIRNGLGVNDDTCKRDSERCAAVTALIEGDASLTEFYWLYSSATDQDRNDIQSFYQSYSSPVYDAAPYFMQKDFLFPYQYGQEFVQVLHDDGGWLAVDNAYANPPISTEQIIHPSRYPSDFPLQVILPDFTTSLGSNWFQIENDTVGEWYTYLILSAGFDPDIRLDQSTAYTAATGWGGDAYQVYENPVSHQSLLVIETIWDSNQDAREFFQAFQEYGIKRWGIPKTTTASNIDWETSNNAARIAIEKNHTTIIIAPNLTFVELIENGLSAN